VCGQCKQDDGGNEMNLCNLFNQIQEIDTSMDSADIYAILGILHEKIIMDRYTASEIILQHLESKGIDFENDPSFSELLRKLDLKEFP
jgi:hypothetical protein